MKTFLAQSSTGENGWLWLLKIVAGLSLVVFLTIHFLVNHWLAPEGLLSYADVIRFYSHPIVPIIETGFLIFAVTHSFLGVRSIILDLNPSPRVMRVINSILMVAGSAAIIYGVWLIITLVSRG